MQDAVDVGQAADADEALLVALLAADEDRFLPLFEVAAHRRDHDHQGGEGIAVGRLPGIDGGHQLTGGGVERLRRA
jgi:hypothetical protein